VLVAQLGFGQTIGSIGGATPDSSGAIVAGVTVKWLTLRRTPPARSPPMRRASTLFLLYRQVCIRS